MKGLKSIMMLLAMMGLLASTAMAATTLVVKKAAGTGEYATLAAAAAVAVAGDTIEIRDSEIYDLTATLILNGVDLKCTAASRATIQAIGTTADVDLVGVMIRAENSTIENIKLAGKGVNAWQVAVVGQGAINIKNCFIQDFGAESVVLLAAVGKVSSGSMLYTYIVNCEANTISFDTDPTAGPEAVGAFVIDHCTILSMRENCPFVVRPYYPTNGSNITVKNSIVGIFKKDRPLATAFSTGSAIFSAYPLLDATNQPIAGGHTHGKLAINHSYNAYLNVWLFWFKLGQCGLAQRRVW